MTKVKNHGKSRPFFRSEYQKDYTSADFEGRYNDDESDIPQFQLAERTQEECPICGNDKGLEKNGKAGFCRACNTGWPLKQYDFEDWPDQDIADLIHGWCQ